LPITKGQKSWKILTSTELRKDEAFKMADWLDNAQMAWEKNATEKNLKSYPKVMDYVNYNNKLMKQRVDHRFYVVYTAGGTNIAAAVVDTSYLPPFRIGKVDISPNGFVPDVKTFYFSTNDFYEACYLAAILNSNVLDAKIKPYQTRGKFGPRDIHRRPFEFFIPNFDPKNLLHKMIAELGKGATKEVSSLQRMSRLKVKIAIPSMKAIDRLLLELLKMKPAGKVENYLRKIGVAIVKLHDRIAINDFVWIKGETTLLVQRVLSMEMKNQQIAVSRVGQEIGLKVDERVRKGDLIFKL